MKGLKIRYFGNKVALCDGKAPEGQENNSGHYYVGNVIKWFDTWDDADEMRKIINAAYT